MANGALVMDTLRRIASEAGLTVIATLHHVDYARRYADRVLGSAEGALVFDGPPGGADGRRAGRDLRRRAGARAGQRRSACPPAGAPRVSVSGRARRAPRRARRPRRRRGRSTTGRNLGAPPRRSPSCSALAARVIELRPLELLRDVGNIGAVPARATCSPSFAHLGEYAWQCVVTVCIALWGTVLAVVISVPLGLLGARNLAPHPLVYVAARRIMDLLRAVNEFVFALMFVTAVGLGPFAGMLALGIHTGGVLGKLLSETIEAIDPGQAEGVAASGRAALCT